MFKKGVALYIVFALLIFKKGVALHNDLVFVPFSEFRKGVLHSILAYCLFMLMTFKKRVLYYILKHCLFMFMILNMGVAFYIDLPLLSHCEQ